MWTIEVNVDKKTKQTVRRTVSSVFILYGIVLLYISLANVTGLIGPFFLCLNNIPQSSVHFGSNYALVYNNGCTPLRGAHFTFFTVSSAGVLCLAYGFYVSSFKILTNVTPPYDIRKG